MDGIYNSLQMEEITDQYDPAEMEQQKGLAIVAFLLPFLFFIPITSNRDLGTENDSWRYSCAW